MLRCSLAKINAAVDLVSDVLPFGRLWYDGPNAVTNATGNVIEAGEHNGEFKEP
jgi:hypothetical protein